MGTQHISRQQWAQIESRVRKVNFSFDPKWKCLIDGAPYSRCYDHDEEDQHEIIKTVKARLDGTGR